MAYLISASTAKTSVAVVRDDPIEVLVKIHEFEDLGLLEIAVAAVEGGETVTRDQLQALVAAQGGEVAAPTTRG